MMSNEVVVRVHEKPAYKYVAMAIATISLLALFYIFVTHLKRALRV